MTEFVRDIDPAKVDILDIAKADRVQVPASAELKRHAAKTETRMMKRPPSPGVMIRKGENDALTMAAPHDDADAWDLQICDAFGTRSWATAQIFIRQLSALCESTYDNDAKAWVPNELELNAALSIVNSARPKNEMEAMLAAQMVAVHFMTMKASTVALERYADDRTMATAGKLARTFAMQAEAMAKLKGKSRSVRQKITVNRTEVHEHRTVIVNQTGAAETGEQDHEDHTTTPRRSPPCRLVKGSSLPSPESSREPVRMRRGEG